VTLAVCVALVVLAIPSAFFVLEIVAALPPAHRVPAPPSLAPARPSPASARVAVLVPAHDEAAGIAATLATIAPQLRDGDRVLVVADNCSDDTAKVARAAGADVVERRDLERRGKGWALAAGIEALAALPPEVVIIVDADCCVAAGAIDALRVAAHAAPAQASYLMRAPDHGPRARRLAELIFVVRNHARPLGLARIGAPCLFTGAGMALPWSIAAGAPFASSSVVEDVQLAVDLAVAGTPPRFCAEALVTSVFPSAERAAAAQRTRWLWGSLRAGLQAPRLLAAALRHSRLGLVSLALELTVPPLSLLFPLWLLVGAAGVAVGMIHHEWRPLLTAAIWIAATIAAVLAAWARFARARVPLVVVLGAPFYALPAIKSAIVALVRRRQEWNRTARD
jgi:cellulose synthase/poly-beta-1,6-N-acetylglucosamine synthase-like glycosyltransferase